MEEITGAKTRIFKNETIKGKGRSVLGKGRKLRWEKDFDIAGSMT